MAGRSTDIHLQASVGATALRERKRDRERTSAADRMTVSSDDEPVETGTQDVDQCSTVVELDCTSRPHPTKVSGADGCQQESPTAVQQFFSGSCVLVTGATGFIGKVLIEKILRSFPGIDTVYALVRPKKGRSVHQRIEDLLKEPVFGGLQPQQRRRLVAVPGDVSQPGLGLTADDRSTLRRRVSVVFHVAASVRLDDRLPAAAATNVRGTLELLLLAREMPALKALVHTSTAYSQCVARSVPERVGPAPMSAQELLALCQGQAADVTDQQQLARIIGPFPNTYVFTKAVAENLIDTQFSNLPVVIFRPSIVVATSEEPFPGWVDSFNGATMPIAAASTGHLRVIRCVRRSRLDLVPCDKVVSCMLAAAWDVCANREVHRGSPPVYNFVSSCDSPLTNGEYLRYVERYCSEWPSSRAVWYYGLRSTGSRALFAVLKLLLHLLPAVLVDCAAVLAGKKPRMRRAYSRLHSFTAVISHFTTRDWLFESARTSALWSRLSAADQRLLPFHLRAFDWDQFFGHYVCGVRRFLLKDDLETLPAAKARWTRLLWLHRCLKLFLLVLILVIIWSIVQIFV